MPTKQLMKTCHRCQVRTMHWQQKPNHILHLLLTIFTGGAWSLVWIIIVVFFGKAPQCTVCGVKSRPFGL